MLLTRRDFWAAALACCSLPGRAAEAGSPPAVMLAREARLGVDPAGFLVSEKLDGVRALWDGRRLRFRSGRDVVAPPGFVARLPPVALDGELWLGRGAFEAVSGLVRRESPDDGRWRALRYCVFDLPGAPGPFAERARRLADLARGTTAFVAVEQRRVASAGALNVWLDEVVTGGGEGLVLHRADALWQPGRSDALLKLKPQQDAEAVVVGHVGGQGRLEGRMGALRVRADDGTEFLLGTGFSDAERAAPPPVGTVVSYRYRGRTAAGVPRFASFLRVREF
ncbi:DNA ligase-1 [Rubrivivax gelatinosus]|uniref:DNA ligase n=2 Tax=Rubrivivax gelatinosus TaxID=28068 RepID=UPI0018CA153B|nr:DNA ligase [Rubrivivax gelatinosus]MBG6078523.1 DNA ligase-1 [Rubrivivax gelatinosus]